MQTDAVAVELDEVQTFVRRVPTRMPFRFGSVTMTELSVVHLRVRFGTADGRAAQGVSSSVLSPMWFDKNPDLDFDAKQHNLLIAMSLAAGSYIEAGCAPAYELHCIAQPEVRRQCEARGIPALPSSFGVALLDSAVVDGLCHLEGSTLHQGLVSDLFGFGPVAGLPAQPRARVHLRHTVGLGDPLVASDVAEPLDDGLPETLEEVVREYGVRYFKVKVSDDTEQNLQRLHRIQDVLAAHADPSYRIVFDGNESYADMATFAGFFEAYRTDSALSDLYERTLWFEQPVERDASLQDSVIESLLPISAHRPVILDESDGTDETVEHALSLGYGGVSAKNCKGIFRTLHSFRVLQEWKQRLGHPGILAAEDLTHPGLRALQQDTAVIATLGIDHAERNGHHYVRGLEYLTPHEQEVALRDYPDLYERTSGGLLRLAIRDGVIETSDICAKAYGAPPEFDFDDLVPMSLPDPGEVG
ncbi:MAG: hypothetical protein VX951_10015 [Planctomycetota bacterium]|nr:hypothetical protein [Planctomycetota bacterium]